MALKERCLNPAQPDRRMLAIESKWAGVNIIKKQEDPVKRRFLSAIAEQTRNHIYANRHQMDKMFPGWKYIVENVKSRMSEKQLAAREQVVAADIATFTTQIVDTVVDSYEQDILFDIIKEDTYTPGQIDQRWTDAMEKDFSQWLNDHIDALPVPKEQIQELLKERTW